LCEAFLRELESHDRQEPVIRRPPARTSLVTMWRTYAAWMDGAGESDIDLMRPP